MCPQLRYMPLTGIEPGTFQSADRRSTTEPNRFRLIILILDGSDGYTNMNVLNVTELYT